MRSSEEHPPEAFVREFADPAALTFDVLKDLRAAQKRATEAVEKAEAAAGLLDLYPKDNP